MPDVARKATGIEKRSTEGGRFRVAGMPHRANPPGGRYVNDPSLTTQSMPRGAFLKRREDPMSIPHGRRVSAPVPGAMCHERSPSLSKRYGNLRDGHGPQIDGGRAGSRRDLTVAVNCRARQKLYLPCGRVLQSRSSRRGQPWSWRSSVVCWWCYDRSVLLRCL